MAALVVLLVGAAAPAEAHRLTLDELIARARRANPGVLATGAAAEAMESQATEARRNWLPSGELLSFVAPVPRLECRPPGARDGEVFPRDVREQSCLSTNANFRDNPGQLIKIEGIWSRTEVRLIQPVWDFGKISAASAAADAGVAALRARQEGVAYDVELNVRRAYFGLKLARALLEALEEGLGYVDEAQKRVDAQLAEGTGNVTVTDRLRLRTVRAEVDARILEARRGATLALDSLRTLLGTEAPDQLDIDEEPLEPIDVPERPLAHYEEQARWNRPEARALDFAVKAKQAQSDLERRREYPDLVLIGSGFFGYAPTIDTPRNAFANNPYNMLGAGISAALRMPLDLGPRLARAERSRAEATEMDLRRTEALGGIALEVRKSYGELTEARARVEAIDKGAKAGKSWITAVAQNFAVGLAEARDLSDALLAHFQMRARYLQAVHDLAVAAGSLARATGTPLN